MRTLRLFIALLTVSVYLISCDNENETDTVLNDYLPLEIGNYWQLDYSYKKEIVGTKLIDNKTYYLLRAQNDTMYYRIEDNKVFVVEQAEEESIKFDLSADVNETWNFHVVTVTLISKTDVVTINNQKFTNCYQFYFDIPDMIDEEHSIWLAPGVGFIQEQCMGECSYQYNKLEKAKIGGQEIDYL